MVFFYSKSRKTQVFAQAAGKFFNMPVHELQSDLDQYSGFKFVVKALGLVLRKKPYPVLNMPVEIPKEICICSPIWGGNVAAPVRYFLQNADLRGVKVNVIVTASTPVDKYRANALKLLESIDCVPGEALVFATAQGAMPELDVIKEHLSELLGERGS